MSLTELLHSGVQGTDPLLTAVPDCVLPSKAVLGLFLKLFTEAGHMQEHLPADVTCRRIAVAKDQSKAVQCDV